MSLRDHIINLIPERSLEEYTTSRKIYLWSIGIGRLMIILTELTAVSVWLSRFQLDHQITTTSKSIEQKIEDLKPYYEFEKLFRHEESKLAAFYELNKSKIIYTKLIKEVSNTISFDTVINTLSVSNGKLNLTTKLPSALSFAIMLEGFKKKDLFESLVISSATADAQTGEYTISLSLTPNENWIKQ